MEQWVKGQALSLQQLAGGGGGGGGGGGRRCCGGGFDSCPRNCYMLQAQPKKKRERENRL